MESPSPPEYTRPRDHDPHPQESAWAWGSWSLHAIWVYLCQIGLFGLFGQTQLAQAVQAALGLVEADRARAKLLQDVAALGLTVSRRGRATEG